MIDYSLLDYGTPRNFAELIGLFIYLISLIIPILFAVTFLFIAWKVIDAWIIHGGDTEKIGEGKNTLLVGIIALVVMSGIWGILAILRSSLM